MSLALPLLTVNAALTTAVDSIAGVLTAIIIVYIFTDLAINFLQNIPGPVYEINRVLRGFCEPVFAQIRRVVPVIGGIDFSPLVALVLLNILSNVIKSLLS